MPGETFREDYLGQKVNLPGLTTGADAVEAWCTIDGSKYGMERFSPPRATPGNEYWHITGSFTPKEGELYKVVYYAEDVYGNRAKSGAAWLKGIETGQVKVFLNGHEITKKTELKLGTRDLNFKVKCVKGARWIDFVNILVKALDVPGYGKGDEIWHHYFGEAGGPNPFGEVGDAVSKSWTAPSDGKYQVIVKFSDTEFVRAANLTAFVKAKPPVSMHKVFKYMKFVGIAIALIGLIVEPRIWR